MHPFFVFTMKGVEGDDDDVCSNFWEEQALESSVVKK